MAKATTRRKLVQELTGSWTFESCDDGAILFYPHGWGRGYLVPTEEKRREIEQFLTLWLMKLRSAMRVSRWGLLPALVIGFVVRITWNLPEWTAFHRSALLVVALLFLLEIGSPIALRFLAETAKADLEKSDRRRLFAESLKDYARRSDWSRLWLNAALGSLFLLLGVRQLLPRRETVMRAAQVNSHFPAVGVTMTVLGGWMALIALWQIRTKFNR